MNYECGYCGTQFDDDSGDRIITCPRCEKVVTEAWYLKATFTKIGDFHECLTTDTAHARAVADVLGRSVSNTRTPGTVTVGVPYWQIDEAKAKLEAAGYSVELT